MGISGCLAGHDEALIDLSDACIHSEHFGVGWGDELCIHLFEPV